MYQSNTLQQSSVVLPQRAILTGMVAGCALGFVITETPALLVIGTLVAVVAGVVVGSVRAALTVPAVSGMAIWALVGPAIAAGESIPRLVIWAGTTTIVVMPCVAAAALLGALAARLSRPAH